MDSLFSIKSPSKVNLGLKVLNKRPDNFHNILSIFIELNLYDTIDFYSNKTLEILSKGIYLAPNNQNNIIYKAVNIFSKEFDINVNYKIVLNKNIPIGAGLGGGSSNAAKTLVALSQINNLNLSKENLCNIGNQIGSDVPFFIRGGIKEVTGKGEIINTINYSVLKNKIFLLVFPNISISTKWAYSEIKKHLEPKKIRHKFSPLTDKVNWALFENDFEHIVCLTYPEIRDIKKMLYKTGALYSSLSGSGSTMFGIYNDMKLVNKAIKSFENKYHTFIAHPQF